MITINQQNAINDTLNKIMTIPPTLDDIKNICNYSVYIRRRTCPLCQKVFKTAGSCRSHKSLKTCQKIKPNPRECRRCLKIFKNPKSRRGHMAKNICEAVIPEPPPPVQVKVSRKRSVGQTKKKYVASLQNWKCGHCLDQLTAWFEVDHTIRLEYGGSNDLSNLVALCRNCHGKKTAFENMENNC